MRAIADLLLFGIAGTQYRQHASYHHYYAAAEMVAKARQMAGSAAAKFCPVSARH